MKRFHIIWVILLIGLISCKTKQNITVHDNQVIAWKDSGHGFSEYIDARQNEFWLFSESETKCASEVKAIIQNIDNLKKKARVRIESDHRSGTIVQEFIDFHKEQLETNENVTELWDLIIPMNRNSIHTDEGCDHPHFLIMDFNFYMETDYVLGVYFNAKSEITYFAMER